MTYFNQPQKRVVDWLILIGLASGLLLFYFGPLTLSLAFLLQRAPLPRRVRVVWGGCALLWLGGLLLAGNPLRYGLTLMELWVLTLPLVPVASVALSGCVMLSRFFKPKSLQEQLAEEQQSAEARQARLTQDASRRPEVGQQPALLRLGARIRGQRFPEELGLAVVDNWVVLSEEVLDQHLFVLGTTGAGKSEALKRLVHEVLLATDRHVYLVDGKGDEGLANDIRSLCVQHGRGPAPVFRLGFARGGAIYDGFRGEAADIYNRLCALIGIRDAEGNAQYYADVNRTILQYVCNAPQGPPRSFEELLRRADKAWLLEAYAGDAERRRYIEVLSGKHVEGLLFRLIPLAEDFNARIGPEGFALEETPAAIFSLRVQSVGDTAERFLDFLVEDLKDFIGKRQRHPAVLVIDEFGQFSNRNITALLSLARSAQLGIILATQDVASLRDEQTKQLVLANTRTKLLMATDFPQEVGELAGTVLRLEHSIQHREGDATGLGSARVQHQFAIDPNEVAQLRPGEAFIIRQRRHAKIQVRALDEVVQVPEQAEEVRPRGAPPPPPPAPSAPGAAGEKAEKQGKPTKRPLTLDD